MLDQLAPVLGRDAIQHARGVEGARDHARPLLALEQPAQQDGVTLVRVNKAAVLGDGADAVGVAIGDEARVTLFAHHHLLRLGHVRLDRFRVDAREQRVNVGANLYVLDVAFGEDPGKHVAAGAIHAIDAELEAGARDGIEIGKFSDGCDVGLLEVGRLDGRLVAARHCAQFRFNPADNCRCC